MITVAYAYESIPFGPAVFLAGPTPRAANVRSWRPDALQLIDTMWSSTDPLTVLVPEPRDGRWSSHYDDQVEWEVDGLEHAIRGGGAIAFWVPRNLAMPGFTTNVEFGFYVSEDRRRRSTGATGRVVLGFPKDCTDPTPCPDPTKCPNVGRNRYLNWLAGRHDVPVHHTLSATIYTALQMARVQG